MGKPLVNTKQWTRNDIRMLIILNLVLVYPVIAGSIFMVLLFFALPRGSIWPHAYWLIASGAWVLLLAIILPLMRDKDDYYEPTGAQKQFEKKTKDSGSTEKISMANVRVEAARFDNVNRDSLLTNRSSRKSQDESSDGVERGTFEEKSNKENTEKLQGRVNNPKENVQKSMDSICLNGSLNSQRNLTQSGEFLNDCIGIFGDDTKKQDNADVLGDDTKKNESQDMNGKIEEDKNEKGRVDAVKYNKGNTEDSQNTDRNNTEDKQKTDSNKEYIEIHTHTPEAVSPAKSNVVVKQLSQEHIIIVDNEEVRELDEAPSLAQRRSKPDLIVDTSLANKSHVVKTESTPTSVSTLDYRRPSNVGTPKNVVHLFVQGNSSGSE